MAHYWNSILRQQGNVVFTDNGDVWVNYILTPPIVNSFDERVVGQVQDAHDDLFRALSETKGTHFRLYGFLAHTPDNVVLDRIVRGIPGLKEHKEHYIEALRQIQAVKQNLVSGFLNERTRIYWLSVRYPSKTSFWTRLNSRLFNTDPFEEVEDSDIAKFEKSIYSAIPSSMRPKRTNPGLLRWSYERATTRGVFVPDNPMMSNRGTGQTVRMSATTFPEVTVDEHAEGTSFLNDFISRYDAKDPALPEAKKKFTANFKGLEKSTILSVERGDSVAPGFPNGTTSYQAVFAISGYPKYQDGRFEAFTSIVDQATGMDGDFAIHWEYAPHMTSNEQLNKTLRNIDSENKANSESALDVEDYSDRQREVFSFHKAARAEPAPVAMQVTTLFAFGNANLDVAQSRFRAIRNKLNAHDFSIFIPTGAKENLWRAMLPAAPVSEVVRELSGVTTATMFSGYAPLRRYQIGDGVGVPVAVNIGNALGQIVHLDLLDATARGNASITITGAQGKGKSHVMKLIVGWMNDLRQHSIMLDSQGEWATFVSEFSDHEVVNVTHPKVSLDPLKIVTNDDQLATDMLLDLLMPMLGIRHDSVAGSRLRFYASPEQRSLRPETNTIRGLFEYIVRQKDPEMAEAVGTMRTMLEDNSMAAFVDPIHNGRVVELPPADLRSRNIVFYTKGLRLPSSTKSPESITPKERYTVMVNMAVAALSSWKFDQVSETGVFVGDEMSFYADSEVLRPLIQDQDRAGRKVKKFVMAGSQTAEEFMSPEYKLVRNRIVMGQERVDNSREALAYADFDPNNERLVQQHIKDTSPLDPEHNNRPKRGREGEGYFNDGMSKARVKFLPQFLTHRSTRADTTAGRYQRYDRSTAAE